MRWNVCVSKLTHPDNVRLTIISSADKADVSYKGCLPNSLTGRYHTSHNLSLLPEGHSRDDSGTEVVLSLYFLLVLGKSLRPSFFSFQRLLSTTLVFVFLHALQELLKEILLSFNVFKPTKIKSKIETFYLLQISL